jgi:peptide/nickel transport system ATP-binding protein
MKQGEMVESGDAEEVIFNPQHEYTQQLLADVPRLHDVPS